jgi:hypothetical protein
LKKGGKDGKVKLYSMKYKHIINDIKGISNYNVNNNFAVLDGICFCFV